MFNVLKSLFVDLTLLDEFVLTQKTAIGQNFVSVVEILNETKDIIAAATIWLPFWHRLLSQS